jgi:hypothetical protein
LTDRLQPGGHYIFTAKTLGKALWSSRSSLRKLDIDVDSMYFRQDEADSPGPLELYQVPDDRTYNNTIGSLHDFEALTHLRLGVKLLLGPASSLTPFRLVDALPKSLRSLTIRGYTKGVVAKYDAAIGELLARRAEVLPALVRISGVEELVPSADVEASGPMRHHRRDGGGRRCSTGSTMRTTKAGLRHESQKSSPPFTSATRIAACRFLTRS